MLQINYKVDRYSGLEVLFATRIMWNAPSNCFFLYDEAGNIIRNLEPFYFEVEEYVKLTD